MQIQIKEIRHEQKNGTNGPFISCPIKAYSQTQGKDVWASGYGDDMTKTWKSGDIVDIDMIPDGEFWKWRKNENTRPSPDKKLELLKRIDMKLDMLLGKMSTRTATETAEIVKEAAKEFGGEVVEPTSRPVPVTASTGGFVSNLGNEVKPNDLNPTDLPF